MGIIVCKFGGTSTANADMFQQIRKILRANPDRRYVVLSAPGGAVKVTDLLYRYWQKRAEGRDGSAERDAVALRFRKLCTDLGVSGMEAAICRELDGVRTAAHAASRGEYLCARVFSAWTGIPFVDAAELIRFDPDGALQTRQTLARFRAMARRLPRAVIPGFYGSDSQGSIVTFPRNGSDITGALAAAGTGASLYENWSDVPGLMSADPALDPHAQRIPSISYRGMRKMSAAGAKVLHPDSLAPVEDARIPTRLCQTTRPEAPGTWISG